MNLDDLKYEQLRPEELAYLLLLRSPEYLILNRITFGTVVHNARQLWMSQLAAVAEVLDIGGNSANTEMVPSSNWVTFTGRSRSRSSICHPSSNTGAT